MYHYKSITDVLMYSANLVYFWFLVNTNHITEHQYPSNRLTSGFWVKFSINDISKWISMCHIVFYLRKFDKLVQIIVGKGLCYMNCCGMLVIFIIIFP